MNQLPDPLNVPVNSISSDELFQIRVGGLDEGHVEALVAECESGSRALPPVVLVPRTSESGLLYYIVDGHHEVEAQRRSGRDHIHAIRVAAGAASTAAPRRGASF